MLLRMVTRSTATYFGTQSHRHSGLNGLLGFAFALTKARINTILLRLTRMCELQPNTAATNLLSFAPCNCRRATAQPSADVQTTNCVAESPGLLTQSQSHLLLRIPKYQHRRTLSFRLHGCVGCQGKARLISLAVARTDFGQTITSYCGKTASRRSRSAANAKHARISSCVKSGKSSKISSSVIPPAKYSSTSCTVIRKPRIHGCPLRLPGSIVIMSR